MSVEAPMLRLRELQRLFTVGGQIVRALDTLDLDVARGEYLSIMGPSGSGKSTLLNIIGLLDRASGGTYLLEGQDVTELPEEVLAQLRRLRIGFVFQFFHLIPRLTAAANIELPLVLAGVAPEKRRPQVEEALIAFGLEGRGHHRPEELSGGQRQRVAIARATITEPAILLADEPTGNLDRASGKEVIAILEGLNEKGLTLLMVTHDPALAERAQRRIALSDGRVVADTAGAANP